MRWDARVTCSRRCNAKANAGGRERVTSGTCALCGDPTDGTAFCSHACASGNKDAVVERDGFAIVYARTGRPYLTATWPSETDARAELKDLLREYPAGSPWRAKIGVAFVRAQEAAA